MAPTTRASSRWATSRVTALPEFWGLVAEHSGLVGAWRLTGVCRASRVGAKEWLRTLRRLVKCGGVTGGRVATSEVWTLDLGELRWERMSDLGCARGGHACCAVRGNVVVLGGQSRQEDFLATVEVLRSSGSEGAEEHTFAALPPLSCGPRSCSTALPIDESKCAEGQVLLLGGFDAGAEPLDEASRVLKVDLATGACTPHPPYLYNRVHFAAARLPDGRVVCAGGENDDDDNDDDDDDDHHDNLPASITAEVLEPPEQGSPDDAWRWRELPSMSIERYGVAGCVLSDGRFATFGGKDNNQVVLASCEALTLDGDERWEPLPPMREARSGFTYAAVGGCVIIAGGSTGSTTVDVYEEGLGRWRRLPCRTGLKWGRSVLVPRCNSCT
jgi:hypothetical protein